MTTHDVTLVVNHRITDDDIDAIFEHADDATPEREHGQGRTLVHFAREAPSWPAAVVSALTDLEAAGFQAASVRTDDPGGGPPTTRIEPPPPRDRWLFGCWLPFGMCPGGGDGNVEGAVPGGCFLHRGHDATGSDTRGWPPARPCLHRRLHLRRVVEILPTAARFPADRANRCAVQEAMHPRGFHPGQLRGLGGGDQLAHKSSIATASWAASWMKSSTVRP